MPIARIAQRFLLASLGAIALLMALSLASPALARDCRFTNDGRTICNGNADTYSARTKRQRRSYGVTYIGGRPAGCPRGLYCGCGLRKYLGLADKRLNLSSNWARLFPRTTRRAGAVAVRSGHVFLLEQHVDGDLWRVRDYNSGGGLSRIHVRSVRGYTFVSPGRG